MSFLSKDFCLLFPRFSKKFQRLGLPCFSCTRWHHFILHCRCYFNMFSNIFISNFNLSRLITQSIRHRHLYYTYFSLNGIFVSHTILETLVYFSHSTWIWWFASLSTSPSFCITNLRYLNCVTREIIWSLTFTFRLETLISDTMNWHFTP